MDVADDVDAEVGEQVFFKLLWVGAAGIVSS